MSGLLLRLAGPMQSWGERSAFDTRDTAAFPTRSGLLGMIAAAQGRARGESLEDLAGLDFTVRVDRPGVRMVDYHTAGGGLPAGFKIPTADGKGRPRDKGTLQTWREYLADAVFVVAVTGPEEVVTGARDALREPHWQPYLGRRSCPPAQPLLLDKPVNDPVTELVENVPVARVVGRGERPIEVDLVRPDGDPAEVSSEIQDIPTRFGGGDRDYRLRPVWIESRALPASLGVRSLRDYPEKLIEYVMGE
ncbi:CRISPR system Cascade subunit CasD [Actinopolyspora lacussalsi]|nr:CRISPR system Cascade subunit CasD [Actinopolyspora lacussalsi]